MGRRMIVPRGTVVVVRLDPTFGHEQSGTKPCILVSDTRSVEAQRFPMVCIIPVTRTPSTGPLYPPIEPGRSGLRERSHALVDHMRSVDKRRVMGRCGIVSEAELLAIDAGLGLYLGLDVPTLPPASAN